VAVPLAEPGGGRNVLALLIEMGTLLAEPARPQPVDEHPLAVAGFRRVVDPVLAENLIRAGKAACRYSWRMPPRRSCLWT